MAEKDDVKQWGVRQKDWGKETKQKARECSLIGTESIIFPDVRQEMATAKTQVDTLAKRMTCQEPLPQIFRIFRIYCAFSFCVCRVLESPYIHPTPLSD